MVNKLIIFFCRDYDFQCDELVRVWVNMIGYQFRVLGWNIGDRFNLLEMDVNYMVFYVFSVVLKKKKYMYIVVYRIYL